MSSYQSIECGGVPKGNELCFLSVSSFFSIYIRSVQTSVAGQGVRNFLVSQLWTLGQGTGANPGIFNEGVQTFFLKKKTGGACAPTHSQMRSVSAKIRGGGAPFFCKNKAHPTKSTSEYSQGCADEQMG